MFVIKPKRTEMVGVTGGASRHWTSSPQGIHKQYSPNVFQQLENRNGNKRQKVNEK